MKKISSLNPFVVRRTSKKSKSSSNTKESENDIPDLIRKDSQGMSSCSTNSDHSSPRRIAGTVKDVIQSPSRARFRHTIERQIPIIYSPLILGYQENNSTKSASSTHQTIPNPSDFTSRWEYMSTLAGEHRQESHILNFSHRRIEPAALKFGITPLIAQNITDLTFNRDFFGKHELPSFLDLSEELFPNLKHLSLKSDSSKAAFQSKAEKNNLSSDEGKVFSADGLDDERPVNDSQLLAKFDTSIAMAERESDRMERLYILYRLPYLTCINEKEVTEEERKLSRPDQLNGYKMKQYEWVTAKMISSSNENDPNPPRYYSSEENFQNCYTDDSDGHEVELDSNIDSTRRLISPHKVTAPVSSLSTGSSSSIEQTFNNPIPIGKSDSSKSLLQMFPHTGRSAAKSAEDSPPSQPKKFNLNSNNSAGSNAQYGSRSRIEICTQNQPPETSLVTIMSPKQNLDSFLQKGNAKKLHDRKSPQKAPSEATDIAIAGTGRLFSNISLNNKTDVMSNENLSKGRREGRVERKSLPLVGSMVKVKIKKRKGARPPPSPSPATASRHHKSLRSRPQRKERVTGKRIILSVSLMDNDEDQDDYDPR